MQIWVSMLVTGELVKQCHEATGTSAHAEARMSQDSHADTPRRAIPAVLERRSASDEVGACGFRARCSLVCVGVGLLSPIGEPRLEIRLLSGALLAGVVQESEEAGWEILLRARAGK